MEEEALQVILTKINARLASTDTVDVTEWWEGTSAVWSVLSAILAVLLSSPHLTIPLLRDMGGKHTSRQNSRMLTLA